MFEIERDRTAQRLARGVGRALEGHGFAWLTEFTLPSGRRADIAAIDEKGVFWIVEVKTGAADFRSDAKWPEYEDWCDAFFFAAAPDFPTDLLPRDRGLFLTDGYEATMARPAREKRLAGARRAALTRRFARMAADRLNRLAASPA